MSGHMPRVFRRETFIALRARRQAHAIAREVLNPHVDVAAVPCRACGGDVAFVPSHLATTARCPACGATVLLPANFLAEVEGDGSPRPRRAEPPGDWRTFRGLAIVLLWIIFMSLLVWVAALLSPPY